MSRAGAPNRDTSRREKIAAQQAAQRAAMRKRLLLAGGAIIAIIAVVVGLIVWKATSKPSVSTSSGPKGPAGTSLSSLISQTTSVPAATLDAVGNGGGAVSSKPMSISGKPLTSGGKPEMLYMGAEYCPFCAAERWAMVVALSRFGTFSGLHTTHSAAQDGGGNAEPYPNTPTWTFYKSTYTSKYLTFTPVEMNTNIPDTSTGGYTTLQNPTKAQQALINHYDAPPYVPSQDAGAIPFVDFGNKYLVVGASYDPGVLQGLTWSQVAADLHNPNSPVAKAVLGTANYMTAAICKLTGDQPASACTATVKSLQSQI
jgi:Domain of unknown function (DUF929)